MLSIQSLVPSAAWQGLLAFTSTDDRGQMSGQTQIYYSIFCCLITHVVFLFINTPENHNWHTFNQKYTDLITAYRQMTYPGNSNIYSVAWKTYALRPENLTKTDYQLVCRAHSQSIDMFISTESKITDLMPKSGIELGHLLYPHTPAIWIH